MSKMSVRKILGSSNLLSSEDVAVTAATDAIADGWHSGKALRFGQDLRKRRPWSRS